MISIPIWTLSTIFSNSPTAHSMQYAISLTINLYCVSHAAPKQRMSKLHFIIHKLGTRSNKKSPSTMLSKVLANELMQSVSIRTIPSPGHRAPAPFLHWMKSSSATIVKTLLLSAPASPNVEHQLPKLTSSLSSLLSSLRRSMRKTTWTRVSYSSNLFVGSTALTSVAPPQLPHRHRTTKYSTYQARPHWANLNDRLKQVKKRKQVTMAIQHPTQKMKTQPIYPTTIMNLVLEDVHGQTSFTYPLHQAIHRGLARSDPPFHLPTITTNSTKHNSPSTHR